jgi:cell division septum initiation protein DivIVA
MRRLGLVGGLVTLALLAPPAAAQSGPVPAADFNELKREVGKLRDQVHDLQRELARLKGGPTAPAQVTLAARLAAAEALNSTTEQQAAFAILCVDAARAGDAKTAKDILARLNSTTVAQDQTYKVALLLARAGQVEAAVGLAKSLNSTTQSQKALAKIAKGELDD